MFIRSRNGAGIAEQPVTTDDNYAFWASVPNVISDEIDFAALHTYANLDTWFDPTRWEWKFRNVPEAQRAELFTRGKRLDTTGKPGTGLGLAIVREIVGERNWPQVRSAMNGLLQLRKEPVVLMNPSVLVVE